LKEEGRGKKEEGRRKKEEGNFSEYQDPDFFKKSGILMLFHVGFAVCAIVMPSAISH
jgi:hypothetical protein